MTKLAHSAPDRLPHPAPEWDLSDLYLGRDSEALTRSLTTPAEGAEISASATRDGSKRFSGAEFGVAVEAYERPQEKIGRIMSYASLEHAGNQRSGSRPLVRWAAARPKPTSDDGGMPGFRTHAQGLSRRRGLVRE